MILLIIFSLLIKTGHICETALLRVYNDIVTTIGRGNGAMLVLLDLSAAFDTTNHDYLFCILEKYVGICGNALKLIKSYFSNRTQCVQIDNVLSDFANIICSSRLSFRTFKILFVFIASERYFNPLTTRLLKMIQNWIITSVVYYVHTMVN